MLGLPIRTKRRNRYERHLKIIDTQFLVNVYKLCAFLKSGLYRARFIFDSALLGVWTDKDSKETWELTKADENDGKTDIAVFRDGTWYLLRSSQGFTGVGFGAANDKPIPEAFVQ